MSLALCLAAACSSGGSGGGPPAGGCDVSSSGGGGSVGTPPDPSAVTWVAAFGGIAFTRPVKLVQHPSVDDRWYVVEQGGKVWTFLASNPLATKAEVLDVPADAGVNLGGDNEQGLLGLAFDAGFATSGVVYLAYTDETADTVVLDRWTTANGGLTFAPDAVVLSIAHPQSNHNGGDLVFGPDGFLYYSMGDGGGADDPQDNGQNTSTLLGNILRIDVGAIPPSGEAYAIPADNPFVGNPHCDGGSGVAACPEIFAWGLRNPWRMHFDPATGALYAGDVGQNTQEEIDLIARGCNYGWDCVEGEVPHATAANCSSPFVPPQSVHVRSEARSITGGAVYRGSAIPSFVGVYVYGDFVTRRVFAFDTASPSGSVVELASSATNISAFGQGRDGEIYAVGFGSPSIQQLVPTP